MTRRPQTIDEIEYELPPNFLHYEMTVYFGLNPYQSAVVALVFVMVLKALQSMKIWAFPVAAFAALLVYIAIKPWDRFGGRSLPLYLWARLSYKPRRIVMPLIMPSGASLDFSVETWEGEQEFEVSEWG